MISRTDKYRHPAKITLIILRINLIPDQAAGKIAAAYRAGCRRFDAALGGLGGCPFAQDVLVGNVPTESAIQELQTLGADLPALSDLGQLLAASRGIAEKYSGVKQ